MFLAPEHGDVLLVISAPDEAGSRAAAEPPCARLGTLLALAGDALRKSPVLGGHPLGGNIRDPPASASRPGVDVAGGGSGVEAGVRSSERRAQASPAASEGAEALPRAPEAPTDCASASLCLVPGCVSQCVGGREPPTPGGPSPPSSLCLREMMVLSKQRAFWEG